jgi:ATP-binding cassette, subfamily B, multidrug efflux pump
MKPLLELKPYLKKYRKQIFLGFFFIILTNASDAVYPLIIGHAIDDLSTGNFRYSLLTYALAGIGMIAIRGIFLFFTRQTLIVVSREIENDLRHDFFAHLQTLSRSFYNTHSTGDIMSHATNDITNIRSFLGPGIMYTFQTITRIIITLSILFSINATVTVLALSPLPFISLFVYKVMKYSYGRSLKVQEALSGLTTKVQENLSGIRVIKAYVREKFECMDFDRISQDYVKKNLYLARVQSFSFPMMFLLTHLSIIIVLYFGGLFVIEGTFSIGDIAAFFIYLGQLTWPMIAFGWIINLVQRASPSMQRILNIMRTEPDIKDDLKSGSEVSQEDIKGEIEFKNVSFIYEGTGQYVLKNINLSIKKGSTLGIIGHTGAGKSTLVNLIPRIYDAAAGEIFIDGINIKSIPLKMLRNSIGIVPQESFLFSQSLEENISYGDESIDEQEMLLSAGIAGLYKDVDEFPLKFKTILGERGITLSGGQKQRTSLARAIYTKPKILILDDALSAVDTHTEEEILTELKKILSDRTNIIISHRISTIKNADNIIVLSNGEIIEDGTHNELISLKGTYYEIYQKQLLEEEIMDIE